MPFKSTLLQSTPLLILLILGVTTLALLNQLTQDQIELAQKNKNMQFLSSVLPFQQAEVTGQSMTEIRNPELNRTHPVYVYRQVQHDGSSGVVLSPVQARGYVGNILLAIGFASNDQITTVHIVQHNETPGLGDQIDAQKTDWLKQFENYAVNNAGLVNSGFTEELKSFDTLSGATITTRGIINAVHKTVDFYAKEKESLYSSK